MRRLSDRISMTNPKVELGRSIVALLLRRSGLPLSRDEEIAGPGARDLGLALQVKRESN